MQVPTNVGVDRLLSRALSVAAIAMVGLLFYRQVWPGSDGNEQTIPSGYTKGWRSMLASGHTSGSSAAPITIVEFSDLECPYCERFHASLRGIQERFPEKIAHTFIHFPLPVHRNALAGARASECASEQGKFDEFVDAAFQNQQLLGRVDWSLFAHSAAVPDVSAFARCMESEKELPLVAAGLALGEQMQVAGTPTIFINGWRVNGVLPDTQFVRVVEDMLVARKPFPGFPSAELPVP